MGLSPDQEKTMELLREEHDAILVCGSAGTGKTHVMKYYMREEDETIFFVLTPTHKAKTVSAAQYFGIDNCKVMTYHQCLSYKQWYDEFGNSKFTPNKKKWGLKSEWKNYETIVFIVDEVSMIDLETLEEIQEYLDYIRELTLGYKEIRVIYIGDDYQLPPVDPDKDRCELSPVFALDIPGIKMTQVQRTNSDVMKSVFSKFREFVDKEMLDFIYLVKLGGNIVKSYSKKKDFIDKMIQYNKKIKETTITVTYSNKSCTEYTQHVKKRMGIRFDEFFEDQLLVCHSYVSYRKLNSSAVLKVVKVLGKKQLKVEDKFFYFNEYEVQIINRKFAPPFTIRKICTEDKDRFDRLMLKLKHKTVEKCKNYNEKGRKEEWDKYWHMRYEKNFPVEDNIVCTAYKSQGSTYDNVFVDLQNIKRCGWRDSKRLYRAAYTAVSRASKTLHILLP